MVTAEWDLDRKLGLTKIHNQLEAGELPELGAAYDALNDAVDACYGWPKGTWRENRETLRLLLELNCRLAGPTHAPTPGRKRAARRA